MENKGVIDVARGLIMAMFVYTAGHKLFDLEGFSVDLSHQVFPVYLQAILLLAVPASELAAVILLAYSKTRIMGFAVSTMLMLAFTIYVSGALLHLYPDYPCSCGGILNKMGWRSHLFFNLFFLLVSVFGITSLVQERRLRGIKVIH